MKNNPFVKLAPTTKHYILYTDRKDLKQLKLWTELKNIPYSDAFNNEECCTAVSLPMQPLNGAPMNEN